MIKVLQTDINVFKLAKQILKNESKIIKKYPARTWDLKESFDGSTGLGYNSLTSRSCHFNVLDWWGTGPLKKWIRYGYESYTGIKKTPLYVQCWANVMRHGEKIESHNHGPSGNRVREEHCLCGHLGVHVDESTSTYYEGKPISNKNGEMSFFPSYTNHWTDRYLGSSERITLAFDINSQEYFDYDICNEAKKHWVKI